MKRLAYLSATPLVLPVLLFASGAGLREGEEAPATEAATLERTSVPAAGSQSALLSVTRFGRYALSVTSAQGMSLQVVDRMAGPGPVEGTVGQRDGRLDVFLERGEYKLLAQGHRRASGTARLAVQPFTEKNPELPLLVELKPVTGTLADLEQVSFWLEVTPARGPVVLEAAGRALADLRLWKDGSWLVDAEPETEVVQPVLGQPLRVCRLAPRLEPGLYQVVAYGGPPLPWSEESPTFPFHLRFGIPRLGQAGRQRHVVSPFGVDRYLVPGDANYFRLELPEARPARIAIGWLDEDRPFDSAEETQQIAKNSVPPVAQIEGEADSNRLRVVTVEAQGGQPYILQHFELREQYTFRADGSYWVSSVRSGHPQDAVDATGLVVRWDPNVGRVQPLAADVIPLDSITGWARRANLLGQLTLFFEVRSAGTYEVLGQGLEAHHRFEPFLVDQPPGYQAPPMRRFGATWELDPGYYVLTINPETVGVVDLEVRPRGLVQAALAAVGVERPETPRAVHADVRFLDLPLDLDRSYTLYLNHVSEVRAGLVVRQLPLDLTDPLPVSQQPGETVRTQFHADERGSLRAETVAGERLELSLDGGPWQRESVVEPGAHKVAIRHTGADTVQYSLALEPLRLRVETPLPALPDTALAALPDFPQIGEDRSHFFDLDRDSSETVIVKADRPALYRLETSGLLATEAALRTRTVTSLARAQENGAGRNALLQEYLREGDYQVTVRARGKSAGHLGLGLSRTRLQDGGFITLGLPARTTLAAGEAVAYRFKITQPGEFRVRSVGLGRSFRARLEDDSGWPLEPPGHPADVTREYGPGVYRLVILPEATEARAITLIEPVARPRTLKGHGPHRLPLARRVDHLWTEPEAGAEREADVWLLTAPAPITAEFSLTGGMQARLLVLDQGQEARLVAEILGERGYRGALRAGRYRLEVTSVRRNNRAPYQVSVWPEELVAGLDRDVAAPVSVPVSVGEGGLLELTSFGSEDVRARLFDASGRQVAENDDRTDDWNFAISQSLGPGRYELRVDPVGAAVARTTVRFRSRAIVEQGRADLPARLDLALGRDTQAVPLELPERAEILLASLETAESAGLAFQSLHGGEWRTLASTTGRGLRLEVPLPSERAECRLLAWSVDRRGAPARLDVQAGVPARFPESGLAKGIRLAPLAAGGSVGVAAVDLERPGLFRTETGARWSSLPGHACRPAGVAGVATASSRRLYVVADLPRGGRNVPVRASRITLSPQRKSGLAVDLPAGLTLTADLSPSRGPVLVRATAETGQPGIRIAERGATPAAAGAEMAVGPRSALSVALAPERPVALVWSATPSGETVEARVESLEFAAPSHRPAPGPTWEGSVPATGARGFELRGGAKRIALSLDEGLVAVLSQGDRIESLHWAAEGTRLERTYGRADRLTLLNPSRREANFTVECAEWDEAAVPAPLAAGRVHERAEGVAGVLRLPVAPTVGPSAVHLRGDVGEATYVGSGGQVGRGRDLRADPSGGTLILPHGPGLLVAWVDRPGEEADLLWGRKDRPALRELRPPAAVVLSGESQGFRLEAHSPGLLGFRTVAPCATVLRRGTGPPEVDLHPGGAAFQVYLPTGSAELLVRSLSGAALWGVADFAFTPATPIGEGLGPESLLPPGGSRLFSFEVTRKGPVGIGVRASADVVDATLLSAQGERLGSGVVQLAQLEPGAYLLSLHVPEDVAPVRARPALAGLALPDTGPPAEVIRGYLTADDAAPSFSARPAGQTPAETEALAGEEEGEASEDAALWEEESDEGAEETIEESEEDPGTPGSAGVGR